MTTAMTTTAPLRFRSSVSLGGCGCGLPVDRRCADDKLRRAGWNEPRLCQHCSLLGLPLRFRPWTPLGGCSGDDDVDERGAGTGGLLCEELTAANDTRASEACVICPGLFGEICAFHATEPCCMLGGHRWSKDPGISTHRAAGSRCVLHTTEDHLFGQHTGEMHPCCNQERRS